MDKTVTKVELMFEECKRIVLQRRRRKTVVLWCERCGRIARMSTPEDAGELLGLSTRKIYQHVEAGTVHFIESPDGEIFICAGSLGKESL